MECCLFGARAQCSTFSSLNTSADRRDCFTIFRRKLLRLSFSCTGPGPEHMKLWPFHSEWIVFQRPQPNQIESKRERLRMSWASIWFGWKCWAAQLKLVSVMTKQQTTFNLSDWYFCILIDSDALVNTQTCHWNWCKWTSHWSHTQIEYVLLNMHNTSQSFAIDLYQTKSFQDNKRGLSKSFLWCV